MQWTSWSDTTLLPVPKAQGFVQLVAAPKGTPLPNPFFTMGAGGARPNYSSLSAFLAANPGWALAVNYGGSAEPAEIGLVGPGLFSAGTYTINNIGEGAQADYFLLSWSGSARTFDAALASGTAFMNESAIATTATDNRTKFRPA